MKQNARNSLRLFHVSEEPDIRVFEPRIPTRKDLDPTVGLVWAIDEAHLPNFLMPRDFRLQDEIAGYYVAEKAQIPVEKHVLTDLCGELLCRKVELRITENLWDIADAVRESTLNWSLCRMKNAAPRGIK